MRKVEASLVVVVLLIVSLVSVASADPVTITMMQFARTEEIEWQQAVLEEFHKEQNQIRVELIATPSGSPVRKAAALVLAGEAPHIAYADPYDTVNWGLQGISVDLEPLFQKEKNRAPFKDFFPSVIEMHRAQGKLFAIPLDLQVQNFFYAEDPFQESGLSYPTTSWSWDDFTKVAPKLNKDANADGTPERYAIFYPQWMHWWSLVWQFGGSLIDDYKVPTKFTGDTSEVKNALNQVYRWINEMHVMPKRGVLSGDTGTNLVINRSVATAIGNSLYMQQTLKYSSDVPWNITRLPKGPAGNPGVTNALGWAIFKSAGNAEEAWEVIKYFSSEKAMNMAVEMRGTLVPHRTVAVGVWVPMYQKPANRMMFIEALENARPWPVIDLNMVDGVVRTYWLDQATLPQTIENLKVKIEEWIALQNW